MGDMEKQLLRLVTLARAALVAVCIIAGLGILAYPLAYDRRIYPGVSAQDLDLGGLTVEEATAVLMESLPDPATRVIRLRAGGRLWQLSWADAGKDYDYAGTAATAYQVAHEGSWCQRIWQAWCVRLQGHQVEPLETSADPTRVAAALEGLAPDIAVPSTEARLQIGPGGVVPVPGQPGRALDLEASTAQVLAALAGDATEASSASRRTTGWMDVELVVAPVPPRLSEPDPARTLARSLLAQPFTLVVDDPLTDYHAEFAAPPERVTAWLQAVPEYTQDGARMALEVDEEAARAWLLEVTSQLGPERLLNVDETLMGVRRALTNGQSLTRARVRHPEGTYVVQPGDAFFDIAYDHGFPQWRLEEANPDVDPHPLAVGMELVIPSIDVLFLQPLVPHKHIEIILPEQRLRAYEDEQLVYDFTCSSGMTSTPTIAGQFQVLFKQEEAYASRWALKMPYFLAIYQEGPGFYNGIHELPLTSQGHRLWAGVLGWPASYGCIILDIGDAEALYNWAPVGALVRITGTAPGTPKSSSARSY